jgi:hypothetical protein
MNDKRSDSTHPSARPPLPSIAPPTDDIDADWGADDAPVPQVVAAPPREPEIAAPPAVDPAPLPSTASAAETAAPEPAPVASPSYPPAPEPPPVASPSYPPAPEPPPVRPSAPVAAAQPSASAAAATPVVGNALRKQTLLGIAPVVPQRSEPPVASAKQASDPPRPASAAPPQPDAGPALVIPAANPLRKQTLLGIAPVIPAGSVPPAAGEAQPSTLPAAAAAPSEPPGSPVDAESTAAAAELAKPSEPPPSIAASDLGQPPTAEAVTSDAPVIRDLKSARAPAARVEMSTSAVDLDLPALRPRRSRWVYIVGAAALLGGGVFALRQMDRAPAPLDESLARPLRPAAEAPVAAATPKPDEDTDAEPVPSEPANPAPIDVTPPADSAASAAAAASAAPSASAAVVASPEETKRVSIDSEPPGARLFWKGKEVGTTPFTLEIPAGARRSYELGKPGFVTRKVVIDGSKSEISIGLKPQG